MSSRFASLLVLLLIIAFIQWLGGIATASSIQEWYPTLNKPAWTPPNWVFAPVWTCLYFMMAIAGWRIWHALAGTANRLMHPAMQLYMLGLGLNLAWSWLYFYCRNPLWGLVDILALLVVLVLTIRQFYPLDRIAAWLYIPYVLWVAYASTLNAGIWWLNR